MGRPFIQWPHLGDLLPGLPSDPSLPQHPLNKHGCFLMKQVTGLPERMETELDRFPWTHIITPWEAGPQRGQLRK